MYVQSPATAVPPHRFSQAQCWDILRGSPRAGELNPRSLAILRKVLTADNGIAARHFVTPDIQRVFDQDGDALNETFRREAPLLAGRALRDALDRAGLGAEDLDALLICTCTGYLCPGLTSYVAEQLGLRADVFLQDLVGLGCGAAVPTLRAADSFLAACPDARVGVVAVEICSAAFYLDNDPGVLISACLFSDGAAAAVCTARDPARPARRAHGFRTTHIPADRELLRFESRAGKLRNKLDKTVPEKAAAAVKSLYPGSESPAVDTVLAHPGGRDVLAAIEEQLPGHSLHESYETLRRFGNMSSPSVLFALEQAFRDRPSDEEFWLVSFGAGFSCHSCRLSPAEGTGG